MDGGGDLFACLFVLLGLEDLPPWGNLICVGLFPTLAEFLTILCSRYSPKLGCLDKSSIILLVTADINHAH